MCGITFCMMVNWSSFNKCTLNKCTFCNALTDGLFFLSDTVTQVLKSSSLRQYEFMNGLAGFSSKFNNTQTAMMKTIMCSDIQFLKTTVRRIVPIPILETMIQGSVPCTSNQFLWASDLPISVWIPLLLSNILLLCLCQTYYSGKVPEMYSLQRDNFNNH